MACNLNLPPLSHPECAMPQRVLLGTMRGVISDVEYNGAILSFNFGKHKQHVRILGVENQNALQNGMIVDIDFEQKTITLTDESLTPMHPLVHSSVSNTVPNG